MPSSLIFKDAEKARDAICAEDQQKIRHIVENIYELDEGEKSLLCQFLLNLKQLV